MSLIFKDKRFLCSAERLAHLADRLCGGLIWAERLVYLAQSISVKPIRVFLIW